VPVRELGGAFHAPAYQHPGIISIAVKSFGIINLLVFLAYSIKVVVMIIRHQNRIPDFFSQKSRGITLKWILSLPLFFVLLVSAVALWGFVPILRKSIDLKVFHLIAFQLFIIFLSLFGLRQIPVYKEERRVGKDETAGKSMVSDSEKRSIISALEVFMEENKLYLNADLSLYDLAQRLNVSRHTLTYVLNNEVGKNFFQYINEYRVEEVKQRLKDPRYDDSTVLEIAFDSGFNSKSSFNSLFKQYCSTTPTQYRKS